MVFHKPIKILKWNEESEEWLLFFCTHAKMNKTKGSEYHDGATIQSNAIIQFEVRYCKEIESIEYHTQVYRIQYGNAVFDITDYDDYMYQHRTVKLLGVGRSVR